jgi:hypothetical protein
VRRFKSPGKRPEHTAPAGGPDCGDADPGGVGRRTRNLAIATVKYRRIRPALNIINDRRGMYRHIVHTISLSRRIKRASLRLLEPYYRRQPCIDWTRGEPQSRAALLLTEMRLVSLAPVPRAIPDSLVSNLVSRGYKVSSQLETLAYVAEASGVPAVRMLFKVLPPR